MQTRAIPAIRTALLLMTAGALAGCAGNAPSVSNSFAQMGGATLAFESIDGPPPQVFERMVGVIDSESRSRNVAVVSREAAATYRVRSYLSAQLRGGRALIAWVWDVYDRHQQRALRLAGDVQTTGKSGGDVWAAADEAVLRQIARAGFSGIDSMMKGGVPANPQPPPASAGDDGPAIASADGYSASRAMSFSGR